MNKRYKLISDCLDVSVSSNRPGNISTLIQFMDKNIQAQSNIPALDKYALRVLEKATDDGMPIRQNDLYQAVIRILREE